MGCCRCRFEGMPNMSFRRKKFFLRFERSLKHENRPEVIVDRGFCTGFTKLSGTKPSVSAVESFFSRFKGRRGSRIESLNSSFECRAGWRVLWLSTTTGGVYLDST